MPENEWGKMITSLFKSIDRQVIEIKKSMHDMDNRFKETEILKRNQTEISEIKNSI